MVENEEEEEEEYTETWNERGVHPRFLSIIWPANDVDVDVDYVVITSISIIPYPIQHTVDWE